MVAIALACILLNGKYQPPDTHSSNKIYLQLKLSLML